MSLVKRTYVDQETVITAENLNAIQDAIIENEEAIEDQGEAIEGKYTKPSGGIPATDMASGVQTSLRKADSAYQKPSGGIPASDMASGVQTSLGKADSALQSSDIDNTLTVAGKAADAKKTGDEISDVRNTLNHKADVIYDTASGDIASFSDGADGLPVKDLTVGIEPVQAGTGDPSPDNVRPISGWTGANVTRTGKNLAKAYEYTASNDGITFSYDGTDACTLNGTAGGDVGRPLISEAISNGYTFLLKAGTYITSADDNDVVVQVYDKNINLLSWSTSFTLSKDTEVFVRLFVPIGKSFTNKTVHYQLEPGSIATAYESYSGITLPISWQSEAGTVYGGTLDVTSGVLTVDRAAKKISDLANLRYASSYVMFVGEASDSKIATMDFISSGYKPGYFITNAADGASAPNGGIYRQINNAQFFIKDERFTDLTSFITAVGNEVIVYPLATSLVIQLDPVTVTTLLGQNNIWADCGPVEVEAPRDTRLYIDRKISEAVTNLLNA